MRIIRISLLVVAASFGLVAGAGAQEKPCMADAARLCPEVAPGGGAQIACLKAHKEALSPACKKKVMQMKIQKEERNQLEQQQQLEPHQAQPQP